MFPIIDKIPKSVQARIQGVKGNNGNFPSQILNFPKFSGKEFKFKKKNVRHEATILLSFKNPVI